MSARGRLALFLGGLRLWRWLFRVTIRGYDKQTNSLDVEVAPKWWARPLVAGALWLLTRRPA